MGPKSGRPSVATLSDLVRGSHSGSARAINAVSVTRRAQVPGRGAMGNFSSKKSGSKKGGEITELDRAILNLKTQRRKLNDQRGRLEALNERERAAVRELLAAQRKGRALLALKKVKLQEGQMDAIDTYLMRVEEQLVGIETTRETKALFDTLRAGADALKSAQASLSLAEVEALAADTAEAREYEAQLGAIMGESWVGEDEAEVVAELEALERAVFAEELPEVPAAPVAGAEEAEAAGAEALPDAPTHDIDPAEALRQKAAAAGGRLRADPLPA
eukprot:jgi/Tetstr1/463570/TSEL_008449.t1